MTALSIASQLVSTFEGFSATPYQDQGGVWTIGDGSIRINGAPVAANTPPITKAQALLAMMAELTPTAHAVDAMITCAATDNQRASLYSFAYNEGINALRTSTLLRLFNSGDVTGAANQFPLWDKIHVDGQLVDDRGLLNRRYKEMAIFLGTLKPEDLT